jgi:hypothetical protein
MERARHTASHHMHHQLQKYGAVSGSMAVDNGTIAVTVVIEEDGYAPISVDGALLNLFVDRLEVCVPETKFTVKIYLRDVYRLQPLDHSEATNSPELVFYTGHFAPRRYILKAYGPGSTTSLKMLYDMIRGKVPHRDAPDFPSARTDVHRQAAERVFGRAATSLAHGTAAWGGRPTADPYGTAPPIDLQELRTEAAMPSIHGAFDWGAESHRSTHGASNTTSRSASVRQPPPHVSSSAAATNSTGATNLSSLWTVSSSRRLPPDVASSLRTSRANDGFKRGGASVVDESTSPIAAASTRAVSFMSPGDSPPGHPRRTATAVGTQVITADVGTDAPRHSVALSHRVSPSAAESVGVQTNPTTMPLNTPSRDIATAPPSGPVTAPSAPLWFLRRNVEKMQQTDLLLHRTPADVRSQEYNEILALADQVSGSSRKWKQNDGIQLPADAYYAHEADAKAREFRFTSDAPAPSVPVRTSTILGDFSFTPITGRRADGLVATPSVSEPSAHNEIPTNSDLSVEQAERRLQSRASLAALQRKTSNVRRDDVLRLLEDDEGVVQAALSSPKKVAAPLSRSVTTMDTAAKTSALSAPQRAATFIAAPAMPKAQTLSSSIEARSNADQLVAAAAPPPTNTVHQPPSAVNVDVSLLQLSVAGGPQRAATGMTKHDASPPLQRPPPRAAASAVVPAAHRAAPPLPAATAQPSTATGLFKTYTGIPYAQSFVGGPSSIPDSQQTGHAGAERGTSVSSTASSSDLFFSVGGRSGVQAGSSPPAAIPAAASPPTYHALAPAVRPLASKIMAMGGVPMPHLQQRQGSPPQTNATVATPVVIKKVAAPPTSRMPHTATSINANGAVATGGGPMRPSLDGAPTLLRRVATTR